MSTEDKDWKTFASYRQMGWWALNTDGGLRWVSWLIRKHWKKLMGTEAGRAFYDYVYRIVEADLKQTKKVVVERFADGYMKVYGEGIDVVVIHRLKVDGPEAEILDEELAELNCPHRALETYQGKVAATDFYDGRTPNDEAGRIARIDISQRFNRVATAKAGSRGEHRTGNSGNGDRGA
jgi:hypothetical protein